MERTGSAKRASRSVAFVLSGVLTASVTALNLMAPLAFGAVAPQVALRAPYGGAAILLANITSVTHCANATNPTGSFWGPSSGVGGISAKTRAWICPSRQGVLGFAGSGKAAGGFGVTLPVVLHTSGAHRFVAHLSVVGGIREVLSTSACTPIGSTGFCQQLASVTARAYLALWDRTNGTVYYSVNTPESWFFQVDTVDYANFSSTGWTNSSTSASYGMPFGPISLYVNASVNPKHSYALYLQVFAEALSYMDTNNAKLWGKVSASVNLATSGNHITLSGISIT